jgi:hypothetical protein
VPFVKFNETFHHPIIMEVAKSEKVKGQRYILVRQNGKSYVNIAIFNITKKFPLFFNNLKDENQSIRQYFYLIVESFAVEKSGITIFRSCGQQKNLENKFELNIASFLISINMNVMLLKDAYRAFENSSKNMVPLNINSTKNSEFSCNDLFSYLQNCQKTEP